MSGDHNTNSNDDERLLNAELQIENWMNKASTYQELMDAHAKELDKAMNLLRWAETEMRYAAWYVRAADNHGRTDVYEAIKEFLK